MAEYARGPTVRTAGWTTGTGGPIGSWTAARDPARLSRLGRVRVALLALAALLLLVCTAATCAYRSGGDDRSTPAWRDPATTGRPSPTRPTLRSLVRSNLRIGSAVDGMALQSDATYRSVLAADFNAVSAENAMKWNNLQPSPDSYDWAASDKLVEFAQNNGQAVYGHTLVWHSSIPSWVSESWSKEKLRLLLKNHITTVVSRYRGKVWAWDVVNEPLAEDGSLRDTFWLRKLGPGYIADAFRWAHQADPDARLFLNDYGTEGRNRKSDGMLRLVRDLRKAGVPVLGVGFQSHLQWDRTPTDITGNLGRFAELGVSIAITELDVRIKLPVTADKLQRQARVYRQVLRSCLAVPTCESVTVWGFTDARSWIPDHYQGYGSACLFDRQFHPKPAHAALTAALREWDRARSN